MRRSSSYNNVIHREDDIIIVSWVSKVLLEEGRNDSLL